MAAPSVRSCCEWMEQIHRMIAQQDARIMCPSQRSSHAWLQGMVLRESNVQTLVCVPTEQAPWTAAPSCCAF